MEADGSVSKRFQDSKTVEMTGLSLDQLEI